MRFNIDAAGLSNTEGRFRSVKTKSLFAVAAGTFLGTRTPLTQEAAALSEKSFRRIHRPHNPLGPPEYSSLVLAVSSSVDFPEAGARAR